MLHQKHTYTIIETRTLSKLTQNIHFYACFNKFWKPTKLTYEEWLLAIRLNCAQSAIFDIFICLDDDLPRDRRQAIIQPTLIYRQLDLCDETEMKFKTIFIEKNAMENAISRPLSFGADELTYWGPVSSYCVIIVVNVGSGRSAPIKQNMRYNPSKICIYRSAMLMLSVYENRWVKILNAHIFVPSNLYSFFYIIKFRPRIVNKFDHALCVTD